jgi:hypothetical protein
MESKKIGRPPGTTKSSDNLKKIHDNNKNNETPVKLLPSKGVSIESESKLLIKTDKTKLFKNMISIIKKYKSITLSAIKDVGLIIEYTKEKNESVNIVIKMAADKFNIFEIKKSISFKMDPFQFHNIIKHYENNSILSFEIPDDKTDDNDTLIIKTENSEKNSIDKSMLKINGEEITGEKQVEQIGYQAIVMMISKDFQKIIKSIKDISQENIEFVISGKKMIINYKNCYSTNSKEFGEVESEFKFVKQSDENNIISEKIDILPIYGFCKCSTFSTMIKIYFNENTPTCIEYDMGPMGTLQIFIGK